jgi:hypothetical protein
MLFPTSSLGRALKTQKSSKPMTFHGSIFGLSKKSSTNLEEVKPEKEIPTHLARAA